MGWLNHQLEYVLGHFFPSIKQSQIQETVGALGAFIGLNWLRFSWRVLEPSRLPLVRKSLWVGGELRELSILGSLGMSKTGGFQRLTC